MDIMNVLRDHNLSAVGGGDILKLSPVNYTSPPTVASPTYPRIFVSSNTIYYRDNAKSISSYDLLTGTLIATYTAFDIQYAITDENTDYIYTYNYTSVYALRCYDRHFNLVWESSTLPGINIYSLCITENYIFASNTGYIYKVNRLTGALISSTADSNITSSFAINLIGNSENESKIIYHGKTSNTTGYLAIYNTSDMSISKTATITTLYDSYTYPYGVGIKDGYIHLCNYTNEDYSTKWMVYPVSNTTFTTTNYSFLVPCGTMNGTMNKNNIKVAKNGVVCNTTNILQYVYCKNSTLFTNAINGCVYSDANKNYYAGYSSSYKLQYGKVQ